MTAAELAALQTSLGDAYALEREIGGGGMSRVFVAREVALDRKVVVKLLSSGMGESFSVERFAREVRLAARLQDPHIVPVLAAGQADGVPYYTMPFVEGDSLRARMTSSPPLTTTETLEILRDVAIALEHAHTHGIVHRDIKPENVLLSARSAVVTDFGIAKAIADARTDNSSNIPAALTEVGLTLGTPAYMAPEQVVGDDVDPRTDLYSWGVVAYEMLSGIHPFAHRKDSRQLVAAHLTETPDELHSLAPVSAAITKLVMQCLAKNSADRPSSATELIAALDGATRIDIATGAGYGGLPVALAWYAGAFIAIAALSRAAVTWFGVPDFVYPGAPLVTGIALPILLYAGITRGWKRAATVGALGIAAFVVLVAGYMTLRALGIGPAGSLLAAGTFVDREPMLVADFRVTGEDSTLGGVIAEAVRADFAQSNAVSIVPASVIGAALTRMRRAPDSRLDARLAHEIAQREGIKGVIGGDISTLRDGYYVTVRLTSGATGDELASFGDAADAPKELIGVIDKLSRKLRGKIGESLRSVRSNPPLSNVTTASLPALRLYAAGVRAGGVDGDFDKAASLMREAIALDSSFAMAYLQLNAALRNARRAGLSADSAVTQAYLHRSRLTEREQFITTADYFIGRGDRERAVGALQLLLERDSLDPIALNSLATQLRSRRDFATAEKYSERAISAAPNQFFNYAAVIMAQIDQGHIDKAKQTALRLTQNLPNHPRNERMRFLLQSAVGRIDSVTGPLTRMRDSKDPGMKVEGARGLATLAAIEGRLGYRATIAIDAATRNEDRAEEFAFSALIDTALVELWIRQRPVVAARALETAMPRASRKEFTRRELLGMLNVAAVLAQAGRTQRARTLIAEWEAQVDTFSRRRDLPLLRNTKAEVALAEGQFQEAIALFRAADRLPDGPSTICVICLSARLARAFDRAQMVDSAIANYEHYLNTPYHLRLSEDAWYLANARERLAVLLEARGERTRAAEQYRALMQQWRTADAELAPRVAKVQEALTRLTKSKPESRE